MKGVAELIENFNNVFFSVKLGRRALKTWSTWDREGVPAMGGL